MRYINVGALDPNGGGRILTKKALKEALAHDEGHELPASTSVVFDQTSLRQERGFPSVGYVFDLPPDATLQVVGPDPYNNRRWYANVTRNSDGVVTVK